MKALHYSCWTKLSILLMCENTVSLFFSISAQGMAPRGMQFRGKKDTVACETSSVRHWHKLKKERCCPWYLYWLSPRKTDNVIHICLQD